MSEAVRDGDGPYTIKDRAVAGELTVGIGAAPDSELGGLSGMLRSIR